MTRQRRGRASLALLTLQRDVLDLMADVRATEGDFQDALDLRLQQLQALEEAHGPDSPLLSACLNHVGMSFQNLEQFDEALPFHLRELAIVEKEHGPNSVEVADVLCCVGLVHVSKDEEEEARRLFQRAYEIRFVELGEEHKDTCDAKQWLVDLAEEPGSASGLEDC